MEAKHHQGRTHGYLKQSFLLFAIVLILKAAQVCMLNYLTHCERQEQPVHKLGCTSGDTFSYLDPVNHFLEGKGYFFFNQTGERIVAGRMPYYGIPYGFFRLFLPESKAHAALVLLQVLLECLSVVIMFHFLRRIGLHPLILWLTALLLILNLYHTNYTFYLTPESFSTSFLVLGVISMMYYLQTGSVKQLVAASLSLTLVFLLKPYFVLLYAVFGFLVILREKNVFAHPVLLAALVPFVLLAPWVLRNYLVLKRFVPFQENMTAGYHYRDSELALREYLQAIGENFINWEPTSAGTLFENNRKRELKFRFREDVFSNRFTRQDMDNLVQLYQDNLQNPSSEKEKRLTGIFHQLTHDYREKHPFRFYVWNRILLARYFLFHSGSYFLPVHRSNPCYSTWQMPFKYLQSLIYWLSITAGSAGLLLLSLKYRGAFLLALVPVYLLLLMPVFLRAVEWRYFQGAVPFLLVGLVYFMQFIWGRVFSSRGSADSI